MAEKLETRVQKTAEKLLKLFGPKGEHWTPGYEALSNEGLSVNTRSRKAVKWCLYGGLQKLTTSKALVGAFEEKTRDATSYGIADFNDSKTTYTHVRRFLEKVAKAKL